MYDFLMLLERSLRKESSSATLVGVLFIIRVLCQKDDEKTKTHN
jgi:hypothetical protein